MKKKYTSRSEQHLDFLKTLGVKIRKERLKTGIKQKEFAELIECDPSVLCRFEKGKQGITLYSFRLACKVLKKSADSLLGRKKKIKKK